MNTKIDYLKKTFNSSFNISQYLRVKNVTFSVLTTTLLIVNPAQAIALSNGMTELTDVTLSHQRGKFISSTHVGYFGVEMVSYWQTHTGELITASANLGIDFSKSKPQIGFLPTINFKKNNETSPIFSSQNSSEVTGGAGLDSVSGVVQNIQVAGVSNGIDNTIGLKVEHSSNQKNANLPSVMGPQSLSETTLSGTSASVALSNNEIGVAITVPYQGRSIQHIRSTTTGGQVQQSVQVAGNFNQIGNRINLNVGLNSLPTDISSGAINSVYSSIRLLAPNRNF